jgi:hypothetical protein
MHEIFNETNRDEVIGDAVAFVQRQIGYDSGRLT